MQHCIPLSNDHINITIGKCSAWWGERDSGVGTIVALAATLSGHKLIFITC